MSFLLFHATSVDTELTAHDWNQETSLSSHPLSLPPVLLRQEGCCLAIWLNQLLSHKKQPRQRPSRGSKQFKDTVAPPSRIQRCQRLNRAALPHRMMMMTQNFTFAPPQKSRLSEPPLQAQLSRVSDRTRLRRLKYTLHWKGAWQQVTRIEDLCHIHVSKKWLYHSAACAGSAFSPHDHITNVQKDSATEPGRALANAVCVDHSETTRLSTENSAAPPTANLKK